MSDPVPPVEQKPTASAKEISKWAQVVAALWIGGLTLVKAFWAGIGPAGSAFGLDVWEIIGSGAAIAAVFSPVYLSILFDKVRDIKLGR